MTGYCLLKESGCTTNKSGLVWNKHRIAFHGLDFHHPCLQLGRAQPSLLPMARGRGRGRAQAPGRGTCLACLQCAGCQRARDSPAPRTARQIAVAGVGISGAALRWTGLGGLAKPTAASRKATKVPRSRDEGPWDWRAYGEGRCAFSTRRSTITPFPPHICLCLECTRHR